jgi:lysozyme family protein
MPIKFRSELVQCRPVARFSTLDGRGHFSILSSLDHDHLQLWVCGCGAPEPSGVSHVPGLAQGNERATKRRARCNHVPWRLIGIMHGLECGYDFSNHLHNGDNLTAPTVRESAGRPKGWDGTGSWEDSAVDAVQQKKLDKISAWSLAHILYALESFNGFG